jgi:heat shock protein HslJ
MESQLAVYTCGDTQIEVEEQDQGLRMTTGTATYDLERVVSASGVKYQAKNDPGTVFWTKGTETLIDIDGKHLADCTRPGPDLRAQGNEPGWSLTISGDRLDLVTDYGATHQTLALLPPTREADRTLFRTSDNETLVSVSDDICRDSMSGMTYPKTVTVTQDGTSLNGCGGDPATLLTRGEWLVEDVNGGGIIDRSRGTLLFTGTEDGEEPRVGGRAFCNRYTARYELTGEGLTIGNAAVTRMACAPALMDLEQKFLDILMNTQRFELTETGALVLYTGDGRTLTARLP